MRFLFLLLFLSTESFATNYPIGTAPTPIITAGDMSAATITSDPIPMFGLDNINIECQWTGTPNGTFSLEYNNILTYPWQTTTLPSTPTASGSPGSFMLDINQLGAAYFHIIYTKSSSTGVLSCNAYGKHI